MPQAAIVHSWTGPVPGREKQGMALMAETTAMSEKWVSEGRLADFAWYFSANDPSGLMIARGEADAVGALVQDPEFQTLAMKAGLINEGYRWAMHVTGDSIADTATRWMSVVEEISG